MKILFFGADVIWTLTAGLGWYLCFLTCLTWDRLLVLERGLGNVVSNGTLRKTGMHVVVTGELSGQFDVVGRLVGRGIGK